MHRGPFPTDIPKRSGKEIKRVELVNETATVSNIDQAPEEENEDN